MIIDKTQLSCIHHVMCMMNIFVVCILPLSYRICRGLRELGTWCGKKICFRIEHIFWIEVSSSNGLSVVRRTTSIFHVEVACAICVSCARSVYVSCSSCTRCFCRSRVRTPDFTARSFCRSRVRFLGPVACFRPVYSWPISLAPTIGESGWLAVK